jgi:hypothetical protein
MRCVMLKGLLLLLVVLLLLVLLLLQGVHSGRAEQQHALPAVQGGPQPAGPARTWQEQPGHTRCDMLCSAYAHMHRCLNCAQFRSSCLMAAAKPHQV